MKSINEISDKTEEGKLLIMAISKITTESQTDKTPNEVLQQIVDLKATVYGTELSNATKILAEELKNKSEYYYNWQANIAMAFKDEFCRKYEEGGEKGAVYELEDLDIHEIANDAAKNFLDLLIER
jgi:hypothetical protein